MLAPSREDEEQRESPLETLSGDLHLLVLQFLDGASASRGRLAVRAWRAQLACKGWWRDKVISELRAPTLSRWDGPDVDASFWMRRYRDLCAEHHTFTSSSSSSLPTETNRVTTRATNAGAARVVVVRGLRWRAKTTRHGLTDRVAAPQLFVGPLGRKLFCYGGWTRMGPQTDLHAVALRDAARAAPRRPRGGDARHSRLRFQRVRETGRPCRRGGVQTLTPLWRGEGGNEGPSDRFLLQVESDFCPCRNNNNNNNSSRRQTSRPKFDDDSRAPGTPRARRRASPLGEEEGSSSSSSSSEEEDCLPPALVMAFGGAGGGYSNEHADWRIGVLKEGSETGPASVAWTAIGTETGPRSCASLLTPRCAHTATYVPKRLCGIDEGAVFVIGGHTDDCCRSLRCVDRLDVHDWTWRQDVARRNSSPCCDSDDSDDDEESSEEFPQKRGRHGHSAVLVEIRGDGYLVVVGGGAGNILHGFGGGIAEFDDFDVFDCRRNTWVGPTLPLDSRRTAGGSVYGRHHTASPCLHGHAILFGGGARPSNAPARLDATECVERALRAALRKRQLFAMQRRRKSRRLLLLQATTTTQTTSGLCGNEEEEEEQQKDCAAAAKDKGSTTTTTTTSESCFSNYDNKLCLGARLRECCLPFGSTGKNNTTLSSSSSRDAVASCPPNDDSEEAPLVTRLENLAFDDEVVRNVSDASSSGTTTAQNNNTTNTPAPASSHAVGSTQRVPRGRKMHGACCLLPWLPLYVVFGGWEFGPHFSDLWVADLIDAHNLADVAPDDDDEEDEIPSRTAAVTRSASTESQTAAAAQQQNADDTVTINIATDAGTHQVQIPRLVFHRLVQDGVLALSNQALDHQNADTVVANAAATEENNAANGDAAVVAPVSTEGAVGAPPTSSFGSGDETGEPDPL